MSVYVGSRTSEFGIRLALGAQPAGLLRSVLREGMVIALAGILAGIGGALLMTRALSKLLFGVTATDPLTFALAFAVLVAVGLAAGYAHHAPGTLIGLARRVGC